MNVYEKYRAYTFGSRRKGKDVAEYLPGKTLPTLEPEKFYDIYTQKLTNKAVIMGPLDEKKSHASATVIVGEC